MKKYYALTKLRDFGDGIINMHDGRSFLATTDFSNKYIKKIRPKFVKDLQFKLRIFNWTDYKYEVILAHDIAYITALGKILNNEPREV